MQRAEQPSEQLGGNERACTDTFMIFLTNEIREPYKRLNFIGWSTRRQRDDSTSSQAVGR